MPRLLLICTFCSGLAVRGHTQSIDAWIEQLAAFQAVHGTIHQGYMLITGGLQNIGGIRDQEYGLHSGYFTSLGGVAAAILDDPRVEALRARLRALMDRLQAALDYWRQQPTLSP